MQLPENSPVIFLGGEDRSVRLYRESELLGDLRCSCYQMSSNLYFELPSGRYFTWVEFKRVLAGNCQIRRQGHQGSFQNAETILIPLSRELPAHVLA